MKKLSFLLAIIILAQYSCKKSSLDLITPSVPLAVNKTSVAIGSNRLTDTIVNVKSNFRLQLAKDSVNTDNIMICFDPATKAAYDPNQDAVTFQGFGLVSLSSFSGDNIPLAINKLPLMSAGNNIGLKVNAGCSGIFTLTLSNLTSFPDNYKIWLMDNYRKDSLDMGVNHVYAFNIYKSDTSSYGSNRFFLKVRPVR